MAQSPGTLKSQTNEAVSAPSGVTGPKRKPAVFWPNKNNLSRVQQDILHLGLALPSNVVQCSLTRTNSLATISMR